jgi:diguanylate cyclase (GGDEF)-like protein
VDSDELEVRLRVGLRVLDLEDRLVKSQEVLQFAATHDDLTRLNNRAAIDEMLRRELARSKRDDSSLSVLLLDIDHFKTVNDTYGHAVGDEVIRGIADRFSNVVRAYDSVGRYGGEEFLAILPGCDVAGVTDQAHRLLDVIRSRGFETSAGKLKITASVGAACNKEIPHATPLTLLRVADTRLYQAKYDGRNRAVVSGEGADHLEAEILEMPIGASSKIAPQMVEPVSLGPPGFSPRR